MQCTHHEVACFCSRHADLDSFAVAHFADENDFGRLAQRSAKTVGKRAEVVTHFPLVERRLLLRMHEFDRVFQRHDVYRFRFVEFIQKGGKRRGLTASGCSSDEDETRLFSGNRVKYRRQIELIHTRNRPSRVCGG